MGWAVAVLAVVGGGRGGGGGEFITSTDSRALTCVDRRVYLEINNVRSQR
jgi:hypothetical protein